MQITIFTDGSSRGNPGPGGWGTIVVTDDHVTELGGREENTTNNRMELTAVIAGLRKVSVHAGKSSHIIVHTDSSYVINGITKWIHGWKRNGWITKSKDDVLNKDLWMKLDETLTEIGASNVVWDYVGGHVGISGNERCDVIATSFADADTEADAGASPILYDGSFSGYTLQDVRNVSRDEAKAARKKSSSSRSHAPAYSYVSAVGGVVKVHSSWAECEKRVKGTKGARYKKALNAAEERALVIGFGGR